PSVSPHLEGLRREPEVFGERLLIRPVETELIRMLRQGREPDAVRCCRIRSIRSDLPVHRPVRTHPAEPALQDGRPVRIIVAVDQMTQRTGSTPASARYEPIDDPPVLLDVEGRIAPHEATDLVPVGGAAIVLGQLV